MKTMALVAALMSATVAVYATVELAFLWPVMALVDAAAVAGWRRRRVAR